MRRACSPTPSPRWPAAHSTRRSTAGGANAPREAYCHTSRARSPSTRAPTPQQSWHSGQVVNSQQPPLASTLAPQFAQPPWHPNSSHPIWSEPRPTSTRRAPTTNPRHFQNPQPAMHSLATTATVQHLQPTRRSEMPTREELAMRPRIRARLARRPNPTRHTAPRAHGACLAAALAAAACMLLLLPPSDSYAAGDGLRGPFKNAMGPSPFYRNSTKHRRCESGASFSTHGTQESSAPPTHVRSSATRTDRCTATSP